MTLHQIHQNRVCPYDGTMKWHQVNVRRSVSLKIYQESYSKSEWGPGFVSSQILQNKYKALCDETVHHITISPSFWACFTALRQIPRVH